jgi:hypothetical protein
MTVSCGQTKIICLLDGPEIGRPMVLRIKVISRYGTVLKCGLSDPVISYTNHTIKSSVISKGQVGDAGKVRSIPGVPKPERGLTNNSL